MRALTFNDTFKMSAILGKLKIEIDPAGKSQEQVGAEMLIAIGSNAHRAKEEINEFMGDLFGVDDFGNLPLEKSLEYFAEFKATKGIGSFFKFASQLKK